MTRKSNSRSRSRRHSKMSRDVHGRTRRVSVHMHVRKSYSRKGYTRHAYTRSDGTRVAATHVGPSQVAAHRVETRGVGHPKVILPKPKKAVLEKYGYKMSKPASDRHQAVVKAAKDKGYREIIRHMNEIAVLMKNSNPGGSETLRADMEYLRKHRTEYDKSRQAASMAKRLSRSSRKSRRSRR